MQRKAKICKLLGTQRVILFLKITLHLLVWNSHALVFTISETFY